MRSVAVVGVGLIGGSIGLALRRHDQEADVRGFDPAQGVLDQAVSIGAVTTACESAADAVKGAEICFVACPVSSLPVVVQDVLEASSSDCVVTDVGSTKNELLASLSADQQQRFIGGHPLAGGEGAGVSHARAELFDNAVWYLTPTQATSGMLYERLHRAVVNLGARPEAIDAEGHDRLMATVSHLPHVLANVLVAQALKILDDEEERLPAVGPSFRDMTRVAGSNPQIWTDIFFSNREAVASEVEKHAAKLQEVVGLLRSDDRATIDKWVKDAEAEQQKLLQPAEKEGPVYQLRIAVPNRPGVVAEVALELGKANVNIIDMALDPAPDMSSGAISLWISGSEQADKAVALISKLGYPVLKV